MFDGWEPVYDYRYGPLIKNIYFQCDIRKTKIEAQAYTDLCIGSADKEKARKANGDIYDAAYADRHKIMKHFEDLWKKDGIDKFSGRWIWKRCNDKVNRSLIGIAFDDRGLTSPEKDWDSMCDDLRDAIVRLKEVLEPYNK